MTKQSMMGSSKYEFEPEQFDNDIRANQARYHYRYKFIEQVVQKIFWQEPARQHETMEIFIKVLRGFKDD